MVNDIYSWPGLLGQLEKNRQKIEDMQYEVEENLSRLGLEGIRLYICSSNGELILEQPYDLPLFERNKTKLMAAGWACDNDMHVRTHCGDISPDFTKGNLVIHWNIDPGHPGSTCKRSVIATEQIPIYEITCLEA